MLFWPLAQCRLSSGYIRLWHVHEFSLYYSKIITVLQFTSIVDKVELCWDMLSYVEFICVHMCSSGNYRLWMVLDDRNTISKFRNIKNLLVMRNINSLCVHLCGSWHDLACPGSLYFLVLFIQYGFSIPHLPRNIPIHPLSLSVTSPLVSHFIATA